MKYNKEMWIVWALLFRAVCAQRVDAGIVRSPAYASEPHGVPGSSGDMIYNLLLSSISCPRNFNGDE